MSVRSAASRGLTEESKAELLRAILSYFQTNQYDNSFMALSAAVNDKPERVHLRMLEVRYKSIIPLQKQIQELEQLNARLKADVENFGKIAPGESGPMLPVGPAKFVCDGHTDVVSCVRFHPKYSQIASASDDGSICIWEGETGKLERKLAGHQKAVQSLCYNPKGTLIASCSSDLTIRLWDVEELKCIKVLQGHEHNISAVCFSQNGKLLFSCSRDNTIKAWDVQTGLCKHTFKGHSAWVRNLALAPNGRMLASCSMDKNVCLWDLEDESCKKVLCGHDSAVEAIAFSNAEADKLIVQHMLKGKRKEVHRARQIEWASIHPDKQPPGGAFLISGSRDRSIGIWDVETGELIKSWRAHKNWVRGVLFSPSGKYILSCSDDKSIRAFEIEKDCEEVCVLDNAHEPFVMSFDFYHGQSMIVSGGVDKCVKIWECR